MIVTNVSARPVGNNGLVGFCSWNLSRIVGLVALAVLGVLAVVFVVKKWVWPRNAQPQPEPQPRLRAPPPPTVVPPPAKPTAPDKQTAVAPISIPAVSLPPSAPEKPQSPELTDEHRRVIEQYKARINDLMTLSPEKLMPGSDFDKQIDALEQSAQPVVLLTGLVYTFRTDAQTKQHFEVLLKPCATTTVFGCEVYNPLDFPRVAKKKLFISKFVERTKKLFTGDNLSLRQTAIRELGLDETTVNNMYQAIEKAPSSAQSTEGEKFFRYFLTGKLPEVAAAAAAADDQKS